ncbi:glycosyltransferase family 4 protein [Streptomyces sp. NPDC020794]|uniref:glycosyltransferase family 4 protein n=1 Tax=unclassified Streptomyces TaxID=2593676 RepID=UPI0036ED554C
MSDAVDLLSLTAFMTSADGQVTVDEARIARLLEDLGLAEGAERAHLDRIFRLALDDLLDEPLSLRVGRRQVRIPGQRFRSVLASALLVTALERAGVHGVADLVLVALTPFLFDVEQVRVDTKEHVVLAALQARLEARQEIRLLWEGLPAHLRHELDFDELVELVTSMEKTGGMGPGNGDLPTAPGVPTAPGLFRGSLRSGTGEPADTTATGPESPAFVSGTDAAAHSVSVPRASLTTAERGWRVLVLADEWFPAEGGISALNQSLCRALAEAGHEVFCLVPSASAEEIANAERSRVHLVLAPPFPGATERDRLMRKPVLPGSLPPDLIIGHSRVTGPAALFQAEENFSGTPRLHFVHMWADDTDRHKRKTRGLDLYARADDRNWTELKLGRGATRLVAVGPRLYDYYRQEMSVLPGVPQPLRLDPGFDSPLAGPREPVEGPLRVLVTGRLGDDGVKGLDLAARAVGHAVGLRDPDEAEVWLMLRGATPGQAERLDRAIRKWAGQPSLNVVVRNFSTDRERLEHELRLASLVLMPSRADGFGLVGLEAIVRGVPVLISRRSGLGQLLREYLPAEDAARIVIPVRDDPRLDVPRWGSAVAAVLHRREAAFADAETVRTIMAGKRTWAMAAAELINGLAPGGDGPPPGRRPTV